MEIKDIENKIINADCIDILKQLPDKCIDLWKNVHVIQKQMIVDVLEKSVGMKLKQMVFAIVIYSGGLTR